MGERKPIKLDELIELREISQALVDFAARLQDFEDKHTFAAKMKRSLDRCVSELDDAHHQLEKDIYIMRQENRL